MLLSGLNINSAIDHNRTLLSEAMYHCFIALSLSLSLLTCRRSGSVRFAEWLYTRGATNGVQYLFCTQDVPEALRPPIFQLVFKKARRSGHYPRNAERHDEVPGEA
jgi:hypothetical protein